MQECRVFKGATRPPLVMGVPLAPMVYLFLGTMIPFGFSVIFQIYGVAAVTGLMFLVAFLWMRRITKTDPWRTKQEMMRWRTRHNQGNTNIWGGVSYAPMRLKKRKQP